MFWSFLVDFGIPFGVAIISWLIGVWRSLDVLTNGIVTLVCALTTFVFVLAYRFAQTKAQISKSLRAFESFAADTRSELSGFLAQTTNDRKIFKLLSYYADAIKGFEGLPRNVLLQEISIFEDLIKRAADGFIDVRTTSKSILSYEVVFKTACDGSHIRASAMLLPSEKFAAHILEVNKDFLARGGKISRIFILPRDKSLAQRWQDYINEQRKLGVNVAFVFEDDIPRELAKDMLILDQPVMATLAMLDRAGKDYETVTVITNAQKVAALQHEWDQLNIQAHPCKEADSFLKMFP